MNIRHNLTTESVQTAGPLAPLSVEPQTPVRSVLRLMRDRGRGAVLVCREGKLVGIFTERDVLGLLAYGGDLDEPIERRMTPNPITVQAGDPVGTAVARMSSNGLRRLPIVDAEGRPTGMLDVAGLVHWLVQHFPEAVYNLPPVSKPLTREREGP